MYSLVIYDTSNFIDFPIGGQLTSIRNFLAYVSQFQTEFCSKILLVGITTNYADLGKKSKVSINGIEFDVLPVVYRNTNLREVKKSLRLEFLKGLFMFRKIIPNNNTIIHYIHTPEAFIQIKICHPYAKTVLFSHGNIFSMTKTFRFYKNNKLINCFFNLFVEWMLKKTNLIFVLDDTSLHQYKNFNKNILKVDNSIIIPGEEYSNKIVHDPIRLLFVGRLSKVKGIENIIKAVENFTKDIFLTIVGDGEERENLEALVRTDRITFRGALKPDRVKEEMIKADILIMNSSIEGKPMTIIEAMSYGLPIITTDVGGISELVEFNGNAVKTDGSEKEIQNAIKRINSSYSSYSKRSKKIASRFDYKNVNRIIFNRIISLI